MQTFPDQVDPFQTDAAAAAADYCAPTPRRATPPADHPDRVPDLLCPTLLPERTVHRNAYFTVRDRGGFFTYEYNTAPVAVLPVVDDAYFVLVRVFRPVIADTPLELPAGGSLGAGEPLRLAARRELAEETGILVAEPERFLPETPISEMPGRTPTLLSVFRVELTRAEYTARRPHDGEIDRVCLMSYAETAAAIADGSLYLGAPAAILARHLLRRSSRNPHA